MTHDQYAVLAEALAYYLLGIFGVLCGLALAWWWRR